MAPPPRGRLVLLARTVGRAVQLSRATDGWGTDVCGGLLPLGEGGYIQCGFGSGVVRILDRAAHGDSAKST